MAYEPKEGAEVASIPFEAVPMLAANPEFSTRMERARQLKRAIEDCETELDEIRRECGAMIAVTGEKSVAFIDLRISNVEGGIAKGKLTGAGIIDAAGRELSMAQYRAIALAAKDCDEGTLLENGIAAVLIASGREPGKPRAGSTRLEWIGAKGKGAKDRAKSSGGSVQ